MRLIQRADTVRSDDTLQRDTISPALTTNPDVEMPFSFEDDGLFTFDDFPEEVMDVSDSHFYHDTEFAPVSSTPISLPQIPDPLWQSLKSHLAIQPMVLTYSSVRSQV
jgi:hypothetical protein